MYICLNYDFDDSPSLDLSVGDFEVFLFRKPVILDFFSLAVSVPTGAVFNCRGKSGDSENPSESVADILEVDSRSVLCRRRKNWDNFERCFTSPTSVISRLVSIRNSSWKTSFTFEFALADVSINPHFHFCANAFPCAVLTSRASDSSVLFPTSMIGTRGSSSILISDNSL